METLDLEAFGWSLQRGYPMQPRWSVFHDERELGNVKSVAVSEKGLRRYRLSYLSELRSAAEYVEDFFHRLVGEAARFNFTLPEYVATPSASPPLVAVAGGAQAQRTVHLIYAWKNANGSTRGSPRATLVVPINNLLKVSLPPYPPGVTQAVIYATQGSSGTEVEQTTLSGLRTWTSPDSALLLGNPAPAATNACKITAKMRLLEPYERVRGAGTIYTLTLSLEECYA